MTEDQSGIGSFIQGSEKLTNIFGSWPTFHDAEVLDFHLWRGEVDPEQARYVFPVVTVKFHVWELTAESNAEGYLIRRHYTLATLRFHEVDELRMEGFNYQNAIYGLSIERQEHTDGPSPLFRVHFDAAFGMDAKFQCLRIAVVSADRCTERGKLAG